jgi:hypothetical protein
VKILMLDSEESIDEAATAALSLSNPILANLQQVGCHSMLPAAPPVPLPANQAPRPCLPLPFALAR